MQQEKNTEEIQETIKGKISDNAFNIEIEDRQLLHLEFPIYFLEKESFLVGRILNGCLHIFNIDEIKICMYDFMLNPYDPLYRFPSFFHVVIDVIVHL